MGEHSSLVGLLLGVSEDRNSILCEFQSRRIDLRSGTGMLSGCEATVKQNKDLSAKSYQIHVSCSSTSVAYTWLVEGEKKKERLLLWLGD